MDTYAGKKVRCDTVAHAHVYRDPQRPGAGKDGDHSCTHPQLVSHDRTIKCSCGEEFIDEESFNDHLKLQGKWGGIR